MSNVIGFSKDRYERSISTFASHVWPIISTKFGPGSLVPVEAADSSGLARELDMKCGIDYIFFPTARDPFGIAQRCCKTVDGKPWCTFTMNVAVFERFVEAMQRPVGRLIPAVIVQAYVSTSLLDDTVVSVDSIGVVKVADLVRYSFDHPPDSRGGPNGTFFYWSFGQLVDAGVQVDLFPAPDLRDPFGPAAAGW